MKYALVVSAQGAIDTLTDEPSVEDMQKAVGGFFERINTFQPMLQRMFTVFANEDGRMLNLPYNKVASRIAGRTIVGNVLLTGPEVRGHISPLTERAVQMLTAFIEENR